ncbi:unnamed protein product [Closterium sp. Naga37s-1]|nr:unnamed protein product [Closterium sp. Naga37s-1]
MLLRPIPAPMAPPHVLPRFCAQHCCWQRQVRRGSEVIMGGGWSMRGVAGQFLPRARAHGPTCFRAFPPMTLVLAAAGEKGRWEGGQVRRGGGEVVGKGREMVRVLVATAVREAAAGGGDNCLPPSFAVFRCVPTHTYCTSPLFSPLLSFPSCQMVRVLVATAVREAAAGGGYDCLLRLATTGERRSTAPPAPAAGLCLVDVGYSDALPPPL